MKNLKTAFKAYEKNVKVTNNNSYTNNLNLLLEAKSETDFLYRYNLIQESGLDPINMPFIIFNSRLRVDSSLETLKLHAIEATINLL